MLIQKIMSASIGQTSVRNLPERVVVASNPGRVRWSVRGMSYARMQGLIQRYNVKSYRLNNTFYICSNNIWLEASSLGAEFDQRLPKNDAAKCNEVLDRWRARKSADDSTAYQQSTAQLYQTAEGDVRFGAKFNEHEQKVVWAMGASARTGGRIPPEFFMENDAYGGTAGNGPNLVDQGGPGQVRSTISMAHDTDWMIGRMTAVGPLRRLYDLQPWRRYQFARMGSFGLFNNGQLNALGAVDASVRQPPTGNEGGQRQRGRPMSENAMNNLINAGLDACAHEDIYYRAGALSGSLNQGQHGWRVFYTDAYANFNDRNYIFNRSTTNMVDRNEIREYNESYAAFFKRFREESSGGTA
jgi:hypothetical protein